MLKDLLFHSAGSIIRVGKSRPLQPDDAPCLPSYLEPRNAPEAFSKIDASHPWRFIFGVFKATGAPAKRIGLLVTTKVLLAALSPLLLHRLLELLPNVSDTPFALTWQALPLAAFATTLSLGLLGMVGALVQQHIYFTMLRGYATVVNGINNRVMHHTLRLRRSARSMMQTGDLVNHLSSDTDAMAEAMFFIPEFMNSALQTIVVVCLLWHYLGVATLASLAMLLIISPLTIVAAHRFRKLDHQIMGLRDTRVTLMSQILQGIRVVKYHAWERSVSDEVHGVRKQEIATRIRIVRTDALSNVIFVSATTLVGFAGFYTYTSLGGTLDAPLIFACLALFTMLEEPFGMISHLLANLQHARVASSRLNAFFQASTREIETAQIDEAQHPVGLEVKGLTMRFPDAEKPALSNIDLSIPQGASVALIGSVGGGKSTLLRTLAGLHHAEHGSVAHSGVPTGVRPRQGYVPQEAFIINATIRENILFGEAADPEKLQRAIEACALTRDLGMMPSGLQTEIGERGVNLSGGQKQRISLARAACYRPGIVFLDDPLSAVDVDTEEHLVSELLFGEWANITRIVVTHRLRHLQDFDIVVIVENGQVVASGPYDAIKNNPHMTRLFEAQTQAEVAHETGAQASSSLTRHTPHGYADEPQQEVGRITEDEDRATGAVRFGVYLSYLRAMIGTSWRAPFILVALIATTVGLTLLPMAQMSWLGSWTDARTHPGESGGFWLSLLQSFDVVVVSTHTALVVYGLLGVLVLTAWYGERLFWMYRAAKAGVLIHNKALSGVLSAPLRFFDSTPMGRILNRFARDVEGVDDHLSWNFEQSIRSLAQTLGALVLILTIIPVVVVVVVPVLALYYVLQRDYRKSAREAKRLESISRSGRYAHFKELVTGLDVVHGFGKEQFMLNTYYDILARYQRQYWCSIMLNRWFSTRVPLISGGVSLATCVIIVTVAWTGSIPTGIAGLVLTYALSFWGSLNWTVRSFSEVESRMTSVERLLTYASIEPEPSTTSTPILASNAQWPTQGAITADNLFVRYAPHLPHVLRGVSFSIEPASTVGIIGRTGSGKSTLFQTLFRFVEPVGGRVLIDGVDITTIPLETLRKNIAIIPQDPTLFIGTIRANVDRFNTCTDAEVWDALRRVQLADVVRALPGKLNANVFEGGVNFSQGQRQLLCMARAILTRARIIVLDEATASVDVATDALIQQTIREEFQDVTVLIIAHRLDTVADADMIIELSEGTIASITRR
jgi:ABC-type multidrug transport system fused ATPase/permease subunit